MTKYILMFFFLSFNSYASQKNEVITALSYNSSALNIGSTQYSLLEESSFKKLNGSCWILLDGRNIIGSDYGNFLLSEGLPAIIADTRGLSLRGQNNGRNDGKQNPDSIGLGVFQLDIFFNHNHIGGGVRCRDCAYSQNYAYGRIDRGGSYIVPEQTNGGYLAGSPYTSTEGSNETRNKSIIINHFIKINNNCNF